MFLTEDQVRQLQNICEDVAGGERKCRIAEKEQGRHLRKLWEEFDAMETADARYAACMDRIQPFLHNTLTDGFTWVEGNTSREQVEKRMAIVKEFMPRVYVWMEKNIDRAIEEGWVRP